MEKGIHDIIGDITRTTVSETDTPMAEMAVVTEDLERLLESLAASDPEAAGRLAPLIGTARAMNGMMERIVAAETTGDTDTVLALAEAFATLTEPPGPTPQTDPEADALRAALDGGDDGVLAARLDAMGDLNRHVGRFGLTPLGIALTAPGRNAARVRLLLDRGARADLATAEGCAPLHFIADYPWTGETPDTLDELAAIVAALLEAGADIEARTHRGQTPLMRAACEGSALEMQALLAAGADPDAVAGDPVPDPVPDRGPDRGPNGSLLVMVAHDPERVALLLDHGADVAASGVEDHIAGELARDDPGGDMAYYRDLRTSRALIAGARRH